LRHGWAWHGKARRGEDRGPAWRGKAGLGRARQGSGHGMAWQGWAWRGKDRGTAWPGRARQGMARIKAELGQAWQGAAWQGKDRGLAWHGRAWRGKAGQGMARIKARRGWAMPGQARLGRARGEKPQQSPKEGKMVAQVRELIPSTKPYFGGVPYGPDIKRLKDAYPITQMKQGDVIAYEDVGQIIREQPKTDRFYAVTLSWRKQIEKEAGFFVEPAGDGATFKVLDEKEKLQLSNKKDRIACRYNRRSLIVLKHIDTAGLSGDEKRIHQFMLEKTGKMMAINQMKQPQALPEM